MTNADMRKLMETVNQSARVEINEAGGIIDKGLAALGSDKAGTRVELKKEQKAIKKGWDKYSTANKLKEDDPQGVKTFLAWWNFNGSEIDEIIGDENIFDFNEALERAATIQWNSGKGVTGTERGGPFNQKPQGDDYDAIMQHFVKVLGGDIGMLKGELASVKNVKQLSNDHLGMTGWSYLKAGAGKKK